MYSLLDVGDSFLIAFVVSAIFAYPFWRLLIRVKSQQNVSQHLDTHQGKQGTPTMGGIIIAVGIMAAYAVGSFQQPSNEEANAATFVNHSLIAFILFTGYLLIGFLDDFVAPRYWGMRRGLGWKQKISMQVILAVLAPLMASQWQWHPSVAVGAFLILFFSNAYNFSDGMDGLAGTLLLGLAGGLAALAWHSGSGAQLTLIVTPMLGAVIPFLYLNAPPAKVFMGDIGSLPIGAVLGFVADSLIWMPPPAALNGVYSNSPGYLAPGVWVLGDSINPAMAGAIFVLSIMMILELVPVPLQILSVKLRKKRLINFKTPIHHGFQEDAKWPETRVTAIFALTQLLLSILALGIYLMGTGAPRALGAGAVRTVPPNPPVASLAELPDAR